MGIDDTAIHKTGTHSLRVSAQYASALGKTANCHTLLSLTFFFNDTPTTEIYTLSLHDALPISIHLVTERRVGDQPRSAAALPRTRLFEPSENTAMLRPQAAIACSADQGCAGPRPSRAAMAFEISPNASSPLSTYMNVPPGALAMAKV